jgi:dTDP-4-amino-4,6-dideoxygalactose transaminase
VASNFGFEEGRVRVAGTNAKLSEYHSAIALAALDAWPEHARRRLALAELYARALSPLNDHLELHDGGTAWVRSVLVVRLRAGVDEDTLARLAALGVETRRWYWPPLHGHPAFAKCRRSDDLPHTVALSEQLLGIPFHLRLPDDAPERVAAALGSVLDGKRAARP